MLEQRIVLLKMAWRELKLKFQPLRRKVLKRIS